MDKDYTFSLIMATYGREQEIEEFLKSVEESKFNLKKLQIIIVDQNDTINLKTIIDKYKDILDIYHIKSNVKGLSSNRNIGIDIAKGKYVAFPDDDCKFLKETLNIIEKEFSNHIQYNLLLGRIVDENNNDSIRKWPKQSVKINKLNFFTKYSSITMFYKASFFKEHKFNENLGVGSKYGSCEDTDIVYRYLKTGNALYLPTIKMYHPDQSQENTNPQKIYNYGLGFGAFCRMNFDLFIFLLFVQVIGYHFLNFLQGIFSKNRNKTIKSYISIKSRILGVIQCKDF
jgi:glycosyltransferase involved in cell wall biosynthesis